MVPLTGTRSAIRGLSWDMVVTRGLSTLFSSKTCGRPSNGPQILRQHQNCCSRQVTPRSSMGIYSIEPIARTGSIVIRIVNPFVCCTYLMSNPLWGLCLRSVCKSASGDCGTEAHTRTHRVFVSEMNKNVI